jgi:hypothetical protein
MFRKPYLIFLGALAAAATVLLKMPTSCRASDFARSLQAGGHVGYSSTHIDADTEPTSFNGAAFGFQLVLGLTEVVGLSLEGSFDLHKSYKERSKTEVTDEDDNLSLGWEPSADISRYFVSTAALSIVYAIDVARLLPYFSLGPAGIRTDKTVDGIHEAAYGFGVRAAGGIDLMFDRFCVGLGVAADSYWVGDTDHSTRILVWVRASALFHLKKRSH